MTHDGCVRMARAFLLYIMRVYLFANGGQMVSLWWLSLFQDFKEAREANWGQACLAYLYSSLDTLSGGTLRQLVGTLKLFEVSSLILSYNVCVVRISALKSYFMMLCMILCVTLCMT